MSSLVRPGSVSRRTRRRLLWLSRHGCVETMNLGQLEDSRRPLLFSLLPRMVRSDGSTPDSLQRAFGHLDRGRAPALPVSAKRWRIALATSRRLAASRTQDRKP